MLSTIIDTDDMKPRIIIVIPARMGSRRLPGKPLLPIDGKPMVQHVYEKARETIADHVIITTPDREIAQFCEDNQLLWMPTHRGFPSGTHRVANIAARFREDVIVDLIVNIQCDEYTFEPDDVDKLFSFTRKNRDYFDICTIAARRASWGKASDPNITKVVVSTDNKAHWFSRAPMRGAMFHCGIYVYSPDALKNLAQLPPTPLCLEESLEQLAFIERGYRVGAFVIDELPRSLNTEEEYAQIINEESVREEVLHERHQENN